MTILLFKRVGNCEAEIYSFRRAAIVTITGGERKGAKLFVPEGVDVRPAMARMRVSVFEILRDRLQGASVLDAFAGTGAMAFDAISRGAARACLVEIEPRTVTALERSVRKLRWEDRAEIVAGDIFRPAVCLPGAPFDLVLVDPPYAIVRDPAGRAALENLLATWSRSDITTPGALFVVELPRGVDLHLEAPAEFDCRFYGATVVSFRKRD